MTRDDIIRLSREAGLCTWTVPPQIEIERLERFAALVAAPLKEEIRRLRFCIPEGDAAAAMEYLAYCVEKAVAEEREACAKLCDEITERNKRTDAHAGWVLGNAECADAIRARGE